MADTRKPSKRVFVVGVGMTKFEKPLTKKWDYPDMAREAGTAALHDAGISYQDVEAVVASYCYGEPTSGQRAVYELGLTGVPVFNTNNNCSSASSALMLARLLVLSGQYGCVLALGFEKMERGLSERYHDRVSPVKRHMDHMEAIGATPGLINPQLNAMTSDVIKLFAYAAREHSQKYGSTLEQCAKISHKNHKHSVNNPNACLRKEIPFKGITHSKMICKPITFAMSAPTADGSAAAVVCSKEFMESNQMQNKAVEIVAQQMVTDLPSSFEHSFLDLAGVAMARKAAADCYRSSGLTPYDVNVIEVHDCFSCNELFMYEAMGLCPQGRGGELIDSAEWITNKNGGEVCRIGGRWVVNPSGGLESKVCSLPPEIEDPYELAAASQGLLGRLRSVESDKNGEKLSTMTMSINCHPLQFVFYVFLQNSVNQRIYRRVHDKNQVNNVFQIPRGDTKLENETEATIVSSDVTQHEQQNN